MLYRIDLMTLLLTCINLIGQKIQFLFHHLRFGMCACVHMHPSASMCMHAFMCVCMCVFCVYIFSTFFNVTEIRIDSANC